MDVWMDLSIGNFDSERRASSGCVRLGALGCECLYAAFLGLSSPAL